MAAQNPKPDPLPSTNPVSPPPADSAATGNDRTLPAPPFVAQERPDAPAVIGPYRVLGVLGRGGMGVVYRAEDPGLKREVALKVMLPEFAASANARGRFVREARAQAKVEHDHVAVIHHVGEHAGVPYLVMPLLKGMTLHAALKANPRPPLPEVIRIAREVAEGLAAAHEQGLIHRDIKPANIWLEGRRLRVRVLDFGLARTVAEVDESTDGGPVTREGAMLGTPAYMSPEQGRGEPIDHRTDLFSVGVILYQMATGEMPFRGSNTFILLTAVSTLNPPPPAAKNPAVPPALSDLIMRLLAKEPVGRPPTAEVVAAELRAIETELSTQVRVIALPDNPPPIIVTPAAADPAVQDPFAFEDVTEQSRTALTPAPPPAGEAKPASHRPKSRPSNVLVWAVTAGIILCVAGLTWVVIRSLGPKPAGVVQDDTHPNPTGRTPTTEPKKKKPDPKPDPLAVAVEWVLKNGGSVESNGRPVPSLDAVVLPITRVVVSGPATTDDGVKNLQALEDLTSLELRNAPVGDAGLKTLAAMPLARQLESLTLDWTGVTNAGLDNLAAFPRLSTLRFVRHTALTPAGLAKIRKVPTLRHLSLDGCDPTDAHLAALKELPLTTLTLTTGPRLSSAGLADLGRMEALATLTLDGTRIDDAGLKTLAANMPALTTLALEGPSPVSPAGVEYLRASRVRTLSLSAPKLTPENCPRLPRCEINLAGAIVEAAEPHYREARRLMAREGYVIQVRLADGRTVNPKTVEGLPDEPFTLITIRTGNNPAPLTDADLKRLEATPTIGDVITYNARITDAGIRSLAASKESLGYLAIPGSSVTDEGLRVVGTFVHLDGLDIGRTPTTDAGLAHLAGLPVLRNLHMAETGVTDAGLKHLATLPKLTGLNLDETVVTDAGIDTLAGLNLVEVGFKGTLATAAGVERFKAARPKCVVLWEDPDRYLAPRVVARDGYSLLLRTPDGQTATATATRQAHIPAGPFTVVEASNPTRAFTDQELKWMAALPALEAIRCVGGHTFTPAALNRLPLRKDSLTTLDLGGGPLTDNGLEVVGKLPKLVYFGAGVTSVTDAGLKHLAGLTDLRVLNLASTNLTDAGVEALGAMKGLAKLDVRGTRITEAGFKALAAALPKCEIEWEEPNRSAARWLFGRGGFTLSVEAPGGTVTATALDKLPAAPFKLVGITEKGEKIPFGDDELARLGGLPGFTHLQVGTHQLTADGLRPLQNWKSTLAILTLRDGPVTDAGLKHLVGLTALRTLDLRATAVTDAGLEVLAGLKSLQTVYLTGTKVTDEGGKKLRAALPTCVVAWDDAERRAAVALKPHVFDLNLRTWDGKTPSPQRAHPLPDGPFTVNGISLDPDRPPPADFADAVFFPAVATLSDLRAVVDRQGGRVLNSAERLERLASSPAAKTLQTVYGQFELSPRVLAALARFPKLSALQCDAAGADDDVLVKLAATFPPGGYLGLTNLGASGKVTEKGWMAVFGIRAIHLELPGARGFSPAIAGRLLGLSRPTYLYLTDAAVGDDVLIELAKTNQIFVLGLRGTKVTDKGLEHLGGMKELFTLYVNKTAVTEAGVKKLAAARPGCTIKWDGKVVLPK